MTSEENVLETFLNKVDLFISRFPYESLSVMKLESKLVALLWGSVSLNWFSSSSSHVASRLMVPPKKIIRLVRAFTNYYQQNRNSSQEQRLQCNSGGGAEECLDLSGIFSDDNYIQAITVTHK